MEITIRYESACYGYANRPYLVVRGDQVLECFYGEWEAKQRIPFWTKYFKLTPAQRKSK